MRTLNLEDNCNERLIKCDFLLEIISFGEGVHVVIECKMKLSNFSAKHYICEEELSKVANFCRRGC
jgi:Holliday junction resolvase